MKTSRVSDRRIRGRASWVLALAVASAVCSAGSPAASKLPSAIARPTRLQAADAVIGALPMRTPIHVEVALQLRDRVGLEALVADNARRAAAHTAPRLLTPADFLAQHAPTQQQAQAVADYLKANGFAHVTIAPNRLLVSADGSAATARAAFMTSFAQVRTADGRIAYANTDEARVPAALGGTVLAVLGLQDVHLATTAEQSVSGAHTQAVQGHYPTEFPTIYGGGNFCCNSNVDIGVVASGNVSKVLTDLDVFASNRGLTQWAYSVVHINGTGTDTTHIKEWDLDSQTILGVVDRLGLKSLVFYVVPTLSNANLAADFNAIVAADRARIIQASVGECEVDAQNDGSAAADDAIFLTAVSQGQTFSVPADITGATCGSGPKAPSWPASSQYVISATGTTLSASPTKWISESGWVGSLGGPSTFEPQPTWQTTFGVPGSTRDVPDVAFDGNQVSGALVYVDLALTQVGGPGLSSSLFTGIWAQILTKQGLGIGFAGPVVYGLPAKDFHDMTTTGGSLQPAGPGYDMASGRGSMIIAGVLADSAGLGNQPPDASFTYTVTGSTTVDFTDTSTDSDGTIAKHVWTFGDGTPSSTAANPSHTYTKGGLMGVAETVVDNLGKSAHVSHQILMPPAQLIQDPSFEWGDESPTPWVGNTGGVVRREAKWAYQGGQFANFEDINGQTAFLSQTVTIPSYVTQPTLSVPLWIWNYADTATATYKLQVEVVDNSNGQTTVLQTFTNLDGASGCTSTCAKAYAVHTYDLTAFLGKSVTIQFSAPPLAAGVPTSDTQFFLDDITLNVSP